MSGLVTAVSLVVPWFEVPLFIEGYRGFAGYQVAYVSAVLIVATALMLLGATLSRPSLVIVPSIAVVGAVLLFFASDLAIRESWRWASSGSECLERCLFLKWGPGPFVAFSGGVLGLVGGSLAERRRSRGTTAADPQP